MSEVDPVVLKLVADVRDYNTKLGEAQRLTDKHLDAMGAAGLRTGQTIRKGFNLAAGAAASFAAAGGAQIVLDLVKAGLEHASALGEQAAQLGVTTDALQEYRYAASQAGLSNGEMDQALQQLTRRIGEAQSGTKAQAEAFEKLGISVKDANGKIIDAGDAIPLIADAMTKIESPAERAAILMDLFGKAGQKLEPLLSGGAAGVNSLRDAAHKLGIVLSSAQIQKADDAADKLSAVQQVLQARIAGTVADNADSIVELANAFSRLISQALALYSALNKLANSPGGKFLGKLNSAASYLNPVGAAGNVFGNLSRGYAAEEAAGGGRVSGQRAAPSSKPNTFNWQGSIARPIPGITKFAGSGPGMGLSPIEGFTPGALVGGLAAISASTSSDPKKTAKALDAITAEIKQMEADVALQRAQLVGDIAAEAAARKQRIDADLEADLARDKLRDDLGTEDRARLESARRAKAAGEKEAVAQELAADIAQRKADALQAAIETEGPGKTYLRELSKDAKDLGDAYEEVAVRGLERMSQGLTDAARKGLGLHGVLGDIIGDLIELAFRQNVVGAIGGLVFGGLGLLGGANHGTGSADPIGDIINGARANGGPVKGGGTYLVGERGPELLRMGGQSGHVIPNELIGANAPARGGNATIRLELSGDIDARIQRVSGPVAVQVVRASAPALAAATSHTASAEAQGRMLRRARNTIR